jgi:hypothetical protein
MSSSNESGLDTWWPVLLIAFGVIFVTVLVTFNPAI